MTREEKRTLRAAVREAGKALKETERTRISQEIIKQIEKSPRFADAEVVALYAALSDEVCTRELFRRWAGKKKLALPSIEFGWMVFREFIGEEDLVKEKTFGILEPSKGRIVPPEQIDVMIVPGLAFDSSGKRLGRGKGFYDQYLSSDYAGKIHKIGVCLPHQFVDSVPHEPHDITMDEVVTAAYS